MNIKAKSPKKIVKIEANRAVLSGKNVSMLMVSGVGGFITLIFKFGLVSRRYLRACLG